jgi:HEAT repeat protein
MMNHQTTLLIGAMACSVLWIPAVAQNSSQAAGQRPTQAAYQLRSLGIELSKQSLVAALANSDPKIRALAAAQLGQDHDPDAIPPIEYALSVEKDVKARIGMASALGSFHDPKGVDHLQTMCKDTALPIEDVIEVVQEIQIAGSSSAGCADIILGSLNRAQDIDYRAVIVTLLPGMYRGVPGGQSDRIISSLEELLVDDTQQQSVRAGASRALTEIGSRSSVEVIRGAMLREKDPRMRSGFQSDLNSLAAKR